MTERLYYSDAYRTHFTAHVIEALAWGDHLAVVLDRTAFYPTSGGQPADRGVLDGVAVLDVVEREADGEVLHVLSEPLVGGEVTGEIDWQRRFDHMQQHSGQHILSAAFRQALKAETVGFHLGQTSSTIDVDVADLEMDDLTSVETLANAAIWDDRKVGTRTVQPDELDELHVEAPPDVAGPIRLVEIPGPSTTEGSHFDINPCGGTHVRRTGEVGMIKIVGLEHRGDDTRVEFLCGRRPLHDYEARRRVTATLATQLTVGTWDLVDAVTRLQEENKALQRTERDLRQRLLDLESQHLAGAPAIVGPYRVIGRVWSSRSPEELRILARKLAEYDDVVALLFSVHERTHFCFARAETLDLDVNSLLQQACTRLDGRGGGRPEVAQGSAPKADVDTVEAVLHGLESSLEPVA